MNQTTTYEGTIAIRGKGTGFVSLPNFPEDILIDNRNLGFALDGDIVEIALIKKRPDKRQEGVVKTVLKTHWNEIIGVVKEEFREGQKHLFLLPDNRRLHVRPELTKDAITELGMKVVAEITNWKQPSLPPLAKITEVLGPEGDHETEMQAIIRSGGFSQNFPTAVQEAATKLGQDRAKIFAKALTDPKRRDFRTITTFTIDPTDAKDFDDALSIQKLPNGHWEIGIHIADVSHYVRKGDVIDQEAQERATSIYLVDRVIPMLPEILSNDLCSLRPHEDRLAFSAVFELNEAAEIKQSWFGQTVINSDYRFSYEEAEAAITKNNHEYSASLSDLMALSRVLRKKRYIEGALSFEQPEVKFELDKDGTPLRVYKKERVETMLMIEDFMLLANESVATFINTEAKKRQENLTFIYRIHDLPNPDKIKELTIFLHALGYEFEAGADGQVDATMINKLLKEIENTPEEDLVKTATIRSMAKAIYSTKNIGHFGLAFTYYTHFTSPIRRYPDLVAHRLLRAHLDHRPLGNNAWQEFENIATHSTKREIEAVNAERDSIKFKQVEYLSKHVGEVFAGVVTGVTEWGIYVQENETLADGLVRLSNIQYDYFECDAGNYCIKGKRTGDTFKLGDKVKVKLLKANLEEKQLDFGLVVDGR